MSGTYNRDGSYMPAPITTKTGEVIYPRGISADAMNRMRSQQQQQQRQSLSQQPAMRSQPPQQPSYRSQPSNVRGASRPVSRQDVFESHLEQFNREQQMRERASTSSFTPSSSVGGSYSSISGSSSRASGSQSRFKKDTDGPLTVSAGITPSNIASADLPRVNNYIKRASPTTITEESKCDHRVKYIRDANGNITDVVICNCLVKRDIYNNPIEDDEESDDDEYGKGGRDLDDYLMDEIMKPDMTGNHYGE
jgi:hypothetical protein